MWVFALLSAIISIVAGALMLPFAWMTAFIVPAYLICCLIFAFKFYLTGGLVNLVFGKTPNSSSFFIDFSKINWTTQPVLILFLIAFGIATIFLLFQTGMFFVKKAQLKYSDSSRYTEANWKYFFYFFCALVFVPLFFLLINFTFGTLFTGLNLISNNIQPLDKNGLIASLTELKTSIPDYNSVETSIQNWLNNTTNESAKTLISQILNNYKSSYTYITADVIDNIIANLQQDNFNPLIDVNVWYNNTYLTAYYNNLNAINQLNIYYNIALPEDVANGLNLTTNYIDNFMNGTGDISNAVNSVDPFASPIVITLYQALSGNTDTNWRRIDVININMFDPKNWVRITMSALIMTGILMILINFTLLSAMLVFQVIYQLLIAPFLLAKGLDDSGVLFGEWIRNVLGIFTTLFVVGFVLQFLQFINPIFVKSINSVWDNSLSNNNININSDDMWLAKSAVLGIFILASFIAGNLFIDWVKNKFSENKNDAHVPRAKTTNQVSSGMKTIVGGTNESVRGIAKGGIAINTWRKDRASDVKTTIGGK